MLSKADVVVIMAMIAAGVALCFAVSGDAVLARERESEQSPVSGDRTIISDRLGASGSKLTSVCCKTVVASVSTLRWWHGSSSGWAR